MGTSSDIIMQDLHAFQFFDKIMVFMVLYRGKQSAGGVWGNHLAPYEHSPAEHTIVYMGGGTHLSGWPRIIILIVPR